MTDSNIFPLHRCAPPRDYPEPYRIAERLSGPPVSYDATPLVSFMRRNGNRIIYSLLGFVGLCVAAIAVANRP